MNEKIKRFWLQSQVDTAMENEVIDHMETYGCRVEDNRWRHFCGMKMTEKETEK